MGKVFTTQSGIEYTMVRAKRKTMGISIDRNGNVEVRIPYWVSYAEAQGFVLEKESWIVKTRAKQERKKDLQPIKNWDELKEVTTPWINSRGGELFRDKVRAWAEKMGVTYNKLTIKDTSSRWGSCSTKKNINFSWKLFVMPEYLVDYLIVHELAHLIHMNHSDAFWKVVENYIPDYKAYKKELNSYI